MLRSRVAFLMHCPTPSFHHSVSIPPSMIDISVYDNLVHLVKRTDALAYLLCQ